MKTKYPALSTKNLLVIWFAAILWGAALMILITGCATPQTLVPGTPPVPVITSTPPYTVTLTNFAVVTVTNTPPPIIQIVTNTITGATVVVTQTPPPVIIVVTNTIIKTETVPGGTVTNWIPAVPAVITNLPNQTVAGAVNLLQGVAPAIPAPYGSLLTALLGVVTLATGTIAAYKNKQLGTVTAVQNSMIQGVESLGTAAAAVKLAIAAQSKANGVSDATENAVNKITGSL